MKSDVELQQDVLAELAWEPSVNAALIGVEVKAGIVTLAGHVDSYAEKWEAERAAQRVTGVKALAMEIDIALPGAQQRTDADIARSAVEALTYMTYVPQDTIKVSVEGGRVTLSGTVSWEYQRRAAAASVRGLRGVVGVSDLVQIKQSASSSVVKSDIEAALKRRAQNEGDKITVEWTALTSLCGEPCTDSRTGIW